MPLYENSCPQCDKFEAFKSVEQRRIARCPRCGGKSKLILSRFFWKFHNPFPTGGNTSGDGEGFATKYMRNEEIAEMKKEWGTGNAIQ